MTFRIGFLGVFAMLTFAGCALLRAPEPPPPVAPAAAEPVAPVTESQRESEEVAALLAYYQGLLAMPAEELRKEYQGVSQSYARERSEIGRLKLALLLCVPGTAWRDDARLLSLLEGAAGRAGPPDSPRRQLAVLLLKQVTERLREQRRGDELQQKLDALVNIERGLRGRKANTP